MRKRLACLLVVGLVALVAGGISSPAAALPARVATVNNVQGFSGTPNALSVGMSVPFAVPAGDTLIVPLTLRSATTGASSCADSAGNTWTFDVAQFQADSGATANTQGIICRAQITTPLPVNWTFTLGNAAGNITSYALVIYDVGGIVSPFVEPNVNGNNGALSTAASVSLAASTTNPYDLIIGAVGVAGPAADTYTEVPANGTLTRVGTNVSAATDTTINAQHRNVTATGTYAVSGTLSPARDWIALIAAYVADPPATPTSTATVTQTPTSTSTPSATATPTTTSTPTTTATATTTATVTPTSSATPTATATVTSTPTGTAGAVTATPTATAGAAGTPTPTSTSAAAPPTPTATPSIAAPTPTVTVTVTPNVSNPTPTPVIPELPPAWLFGTGLVALGWFARRR